MDYKRIAFYYGQGATYNSIEGRFRIAKKLGFKLAEQAEAEGRSMPVPIPKSGTNSPRKLSTPKKSGHMSDGMQLGLYIIVLMTQLGYEFDCIYDCKVTRPVMASDPIVTEAEGFVWTHEPDVISPKEIVPLLDLVFRSPFLIDLTDYMFLGSRLTIL